MGERSLARKSHHISRAVLASILSLTMEFRNLATTPNFTDGDRQRIQILTAKYVNIAVNKSLKSLRDQFQMIEHPTVLQRSAALRAKEVLQHRYNLLTRSL